jgi:hypothetical protein
MQQGAHAAEELVARVLQGHALVWDARENERSRPWLTGCRRHGGGGLGQQLPRRGRRGRPVDDEEFNLDLDMAGTVL